MHSELLIYYQNLVRDLQRRIKEKDQEINSLKSKLNGNNQKLDD